MKHSLKTELGTELYDEIISILSGDIDKKVLETFPKAKLNRIEKFYLNHVEDIEVQIVYNFLSYFSIFGIGGSVIEEEVDVDISKYDGYISLS